MCYLIFYATEFRDYNYIISSLVRLYRVLCHSLLRKSYIVHQILSKYQSNKRYIPHNWEKKIYNKKPSKILARYFTISLICNHVQRIQRPTIGKMIKVFDIVASSNLLWRNTCKLTWHYKALPPLFDIREAAVAAAVGTMPVETPGFERCRSLHKK